MAIRYRVTKRTDSINKKEKFIMQAVNTGTIDLNRISKDISNECTLSVVDVKAVIMALGGKLQQHLEEGKIVDLGEVGKFKIGFKCKAEDSEQLLSPKRSIKKYHLNYQASKEIKHRLKNAIITYKEGSKSR